MSFFVAGGTVPPGSPSYVERAADRELFEALLGGEFCYVLNSRQMGKSSLAVRTIAKLQEAGVRTAFVDLTKIGSASLSAEQWYAGLLAEVGRALGLRAEAVRAWRESPELGYAQRLFGFLQERATERPTVVMIDEIDATRSLGFSTDEFFAGIRQCWNARATDPGQANLTLCLLGAALPSDLIRDPRATPFNVGRRIELRDFTPGEARPFAGVVGEAALARVLFWTGGHPFLTQSLCAGLEGDVDALVRSRYLDARAREADTNLADVGRRMLGTGDPNVSDEDRATTLALYERMLQGRDVPDDESNPAAARIKMSGVARVEGGLLTPRNRIYVEAFGREWVRENTPGHELRRQRRAFWRGALRAGAVGTLVAATIAGLAVAAVVNERKAREAEARARRQRDKARYDAYVAAMRNMNEVRDENNLTLLDQRVQDLKREPFRGWEWRFWNRVANRAKVRVAVGRYNSAWLMPSPDGRLGVSGNAKGIGVFDLATGRLVREIDSPNPSSTPAWLGDSRRFLVADAGPGLGARLFDARTGRLMGKSRNEGIVNLTISRPVLPNDREAIVQAQGRVVLLDLQTMRERPYGKGLPIFFNLDVGRSGRFAVFVHSSGPCVLRETSTGRAIREFNVGERIFLARLSPDERTVAISTFKGKVALVDVATGRAWWSRRLIKGQVQSLSFSPQGDRLLVGGRQSREAALFSIQGHTVDGLQSFRDSSNVAILPNGRDVMVGYDDFRIYDSREEPEVPTVRNPTRDVMDGAIDASGTLVASDGETACRTSLATRGAKPERLAGRWLAPLPGGRFWLDSRSGDKAGVMDAERGERRLVSFVPPAGMGLASVGWNGQYRVRVVWETASGQDAILIDPVDGGHVVRIDIPSTVDRLRFSDDGRLLAVGLRNCQFAVYRVADGERLWIDPEPRNMVRSLAFSPDGTRVAAGGDDDQAHVWDLASGRLLATMVGHSQSVMSLDWSPDSRRIVTGGGDATVRIWDAATGEGLGILGRHDASVLSVRFLPGGRTLASYSVDGVAKLWMTEDRR